MNILVGPSGLEPPTSCLSGTRSNLLSYEPMWLVSDLSFHLNFNYALCILHSALQLVSSCLVEMMGFEPMTPCLQGRCSPSWATPPFYWVLLFISVFFIDRGSLFASPIWRCRHWAIFPRSFPRSIVATAELNFRVRNGNGWTLCVCNTDYAFSRMLDPWKLNNNFLFELY